MTLVAPAAALLWTPRDLARQTPRKDRDVLCCLDLSGIVGFTVAMTCLLAFLLSIPAPNRIVLAVAVVLFAAVTLGELRARHPFVDVRLPVRNAPVTGTYLGYALVALCACTVPYITQRLEAARGMSALTAGLLLLPTSVISGVAVVPISRRNLVRRPVTAAGLASPVESAGVPFLVSDTSIPWIVAITLLFGIALGTGTGAEQIAPYTQAPPDRLGVASGPLRTFGHIGCIASTAMKGTNSCPIPSAPCCAIAMPDTTPSSGPAPTCRHPKASR